VTLASYRAFVRVKVTLLRASQLGDTADDERRGDDGHLTLAVGTGP